MKLVKILLIIFSSLIAIFALFLYTVLHHANKLSYDDDNVSYHFTYSMSYTDKKTNGRIRVYHLDSFCIKSLSYCEPLPIKDTRIYLEKDEYIKNLSLDSYSEEPFDVTPIYLVKVETNMGKQSVIMIPNRVAEPFSYTARNPSERFYGHYAHKIEYRGLRDGYWYMFDYTDDGNDDPNMWLGISEDKDVYRE